jgi:type I restriction enzyme S subunit
MSEEVKPGYKQTEVGVIPKEWEVQSLEGIADPKRPICYGIVQVGPFTRNGIPVLAIKNLNTDYLTNVHRSSPEIETPYARSRVSPGDVLISVKGTTGRVGIVPLHFDGNISRDIARLRLTDEDMPEFWFQMLQSETAQRKLGVATVGTTRMELSIGILKHVRMPRPPKEEQRAIAGVLSDVDALIGALDRLISKKRDLKQAAMQQLLTGQTRLAEFGGSHRSFKQTEAGLLPEDWRLPKVKDVASITTGKRNTQDRIDDGQYPFFVRSQTVERINSYSFDGEAVLTAGDGVGTGKVFHYINGRFDFHQRVYKISDFSADLCGFYFYLYFSRNFFDRIMAMTAKSSVDSVRMDMIAEMWIPLPSLPEQTAIAEVLSDMDAELAALTQRRDKTRALKQGMMQELLMGRTRLV